jgi:putative copper resistance protein D
MTIQITEEQKNALRKFSSTGHTMVFVAIVLGVNNTILICHWFYPSSSNSYDAMLTLKIAIVAVMVAVVNRYAIVPRLVDNRRSAAVLEVFTGVEFVLAGVVLIVINLSSALNPY